MAEVSVRERIAREIKSRMGSITGVGTVHRQDAHITYFGDKDIVVGCGQERVNRGESNISLTQKTLPIVTAVYLYQSESASESTDELVNDWLQRMAEQILTDENLKDTHGDQLAIRSVPVLAGPVRIGEPGEAVDGARIRWEIIYSHDRQNVAKPQAGSVVTE